MKSRKNRQAGRVYLVMELLPGSTLRQELHRNQRLSPERAANILSGICAAVDAAHKRLILHRDLKPENIFLENTDNAETAKILDFGVVKFLAEETGNLGSSPLPFCLSCSFTVGKFSILRGARENSGTFPPQPMPFMPFCSCPEKSNYYQLEKASVNLDLLPAGLHYRVREVITRCLQKDAKKRYSKPVCPGSFFEANIFPLQDTCGILAPTASVS